MMETLRLESVAASAQRVLPMRRMGMSDRGLLAAKAATLAVAVAIGLRPPLVRVIVRMDDGIELCCPWRWSATWAVLAGAEVCEPAVGAYRARQRKNAPRSCTAFVYRFAWSDFERLCELQPGHRLEQGWRDDETRVLSEVARYLDLRGPVEGVTRTRLGGRSALAAAARRFDGCAELVVAPGVDLVYLLFHAPDEEAWRRAMRARCAMRAAVRLADSGPATPLAERPVPLPPGLDAW